MARQTNFQNAKGKEYFRINRKVGTKLNSNGEWVPVKKQFYGESKKEAEEKYEEYMREQALNKSPILEEPLGKAIDEWIDTFFDHYDLADSTKALYVNSYRKYFRETNVAATPLKEVSAIMIQRFYNGCYLKNSNLKAINKLLGNFYRHCELNGICSDITTCLSVPKKDTKDKLDYVKNIEVWDDDDLKKVINALTGTKLRFLVIMAVNTGARFSELLALEYTDIQDNVLTINKQITETSYGDRKGARLSNTKSACSNRQITLSEEVLRELDKHKTVHRAEMLRRGYITNIIFSTDVGTYSSKTTIRRMLNKVYKKIGVPEHTFHSFRHTFGTNLSRAGVPIERTSKLMGHSSPDITQQYYINVGNEEQLDAVNKIVKFSLG